jgi:predicted acyl esterase
MRTFFSRFVTAWVLGLGLLSALPAWAGNFSISYQRIPAVDGQTLSAAVIVPQGQGPGPFPLIVMATSWATPNLEYVGRGTILAAQGYVVISYTSRGFYDSQGLVDFFGPKTVADTSKVIDWALAHTPSDPDRIGASGISYGSGTSTLAAARDPRIKAVAALSTGGDFGEAFYANQTASQQVLALLASTGVLTGRSTPELNAVWQKVFTGQFDAAGKAMVDLSASRSPTQDAKAGRLNKTAVLLANGINDGLVPPNQLVTLFQSLGGPKQLIFSQGDHATADLPGAFGLPNEVYDAATRWFDHYLKGIDNGVNREPPVRLQTVGKSWLTYPDWDSVQARLTTYRLSKPSGWIPTGTLATGGGTGAWSTSIFTALPTEANSGAIELTGLFQSLFGIAPSASIPLIPRFSASVWQGPVYTTRKMLAGISTLHLTVTPNQPDVSLYTYLYSVDASGRGSLLTHKPYSLHQAAPGQPRTLEIQLEAAATEIPAGNRLAVVIGTLDPRYGGVTTPGGTVTFSASAADPAWLSVPLR